jgi:hypothetical protein
LTETVANAVSVKTHDCKETAASRDAAVSFMGRNEFRQT